MRTEVEPVSERNVVVRPGKHTGWWVVGRKSNTRVFMYVWMPTRSLADAVARWAGGGKGEPTSSG